LRERASAKATEGLIDSAVIPGVQDAVIATQSAVVH
jgi:hypothetical protein